MAQGNIWEVLAMVSTTWKIKTGSSILDFYAELIQFILYNHFQNGLGDHFKV